MSETETLIASIRALAIKLNRSPITLSAKLLGSGKTLSELEAGRTITLAKYERAMAQLDDLEREAA